MALPIILTIVTYFSDKDIILFQLLFPGFDTRLFAMQPRCHGRASCFPSPWISTHSERLMKQRSHCCTLYPAHFPASKDVWYLARLCRRRRDCDVVLLASSIFFQWRRRFFLSTRNWNAVDFCQASVNWTIFFSLPFIFLSTERERGEKLTS